MLVVGIALFTMGDVDARPSFDPQGVAVIVAALFLDSFAANFEERRLFDVPDPSSHAEVVFHANAVGAAFTVCAMAVTGELSQALQSLGLKSSSGGARDASSTGSFAAALPAVLMSAAFGTSASPSSSCSYGTSARPTRRSSRARGSWCPSRRAFCCTPSPWGGSTRGERRARCAACITSTS